LGQVHDIQVLHQGFQDLIGLLLAVTGILPDDDVACLQIGAHLAQLEAEGGFDEGAGVPRQDRFRPGEIELRPGAQPHGHPIDGQDQLLRNEDAIGADDLSPLGLGVHQFLDPQTVDLAHDEIEIFHPLGAILLAQVNLPVGPAQHGQQCVMAFQIESQFLPHSSVIRHCTTSS